MATKFRFICLIPDLVHRARFKPPADKHSFLPVKPKEDAPASGPGETPVPTPRPYRF